MLNVIMLSCRYAECHYAECHYAECRGAAQSLQLTRFKFGITEKKFYSIELFLLKMKRIYLK